MMSRILAIDDDRQILSIVKKALEHDRHIVDTYESTEAISLEQLTNYQLILLDVMMSGTDGFTFCRNIRSMVDCPILFLTAKSLDADLTEGLAIGGDDYIKKPFSISELRARVNAHLRREAREYHTRIISHNYVFNLSEKQLYYHDEFIKMTKSEYEVCEFLVRNKGQVFTLEQLVEKIFGYDCESDNSIIREHIKNIRAKLKQFGVSPIETIWGIGYRWIS